MNRLLLRLSTAAWNRPSAKQCLPASRKTRQHTSTNHQEIQVALNNHAVSFTRQRCCTLEPTVRGCVYVGDLHTRTLLFAIVDNAPCRNHGKHSHTLESPGRSYAAEVTLHLLTSFSKKVLKICFIYSQACVILTAHVIVRGSRNVTHYV